MPVIKTTKGGKTAYKWGPRGKFYTGKGARQKAAAQGRAVKAQQSKEKR